MLSTLSSASVGRTSTVVGWMRSGCAKKSNSSGADVLMLIRWTYSDASIIAPMFASTLDATRKQLSWPMSMAAVPLIGAVEPSWNNSVRLARSSDACSTDALKHSRNVTEAAETLVVLAAVSAKRVAAFGEAMYISVDKKDVASVLAVAVVLEAERCDLDRPVSALPASQIAIDVLLAIVSCADEPPAGPRVTTMAKGSLRYVTRAALDNIIEPGVKSGSCDGRRAHAITGADAPGQPPIKEGRAAGQHGRRSAARGCHHTEPQSHVSLSAENELLFEESSDC